MNITSTSWASSVRQEVKQKQEVEERTEPFTPSSSSSAPPTRLPACQRLMSDVFSLSVSGSTLTQAPNMAATTPMSPEEEEELREAFAKIGKRRAAFPLSPAAEN